MNPLWNATLNLVGQGIEGQLASETDDYNPKTGKLERGAGEQWWDDFFGRTEGIQAQAAKDYVKDLKGSAAAQQLEVLRPGEADIGDRTTRADVARQLKDATIADQLIGTIMGTGQSNYTRSQLEAMDNSELTAMIPGLKQKAEAVAYTNNPAVVEANKRFEASEKRQARLDAERIAERREARLDRLDEGQANRDLQRLRLGAEERMFNQKLAADAKAARKEKMAAIIAGLSQLGASFAI